MQKTDIPERLRKDAASTWEEIKSQPFVVELYEGSLPPEKFNFYVLQDYNFLVAMMRNFGILSAKAENVTVMRGILEIAYLEATSEFKGYEELLGKLGYTLTEAIRAEPTLVNTSYTSFLLATSSLKSFWEGLAAIMPCFWTYAEIASHHKDKLKQNENGLYLKWASVYLSESYRALVDKLKGLLACAPDADYEKLKEVFLIASKYELAYWDMAYSMKE